MVFGLIDLLIFDYTTVIKRYEVKNITSTTVYLRNLTVQYRVMNLSQICTISSEHVMSYVLTYVVCKDNTQSSECNLTTYNKEIVINEILFSDHKALYRMFVLEFNF